MQKGFARIDIIKWITFFHFIERKLTPVVKCPGNIFNLQYLVAFMQRDN